MQVFAILQNANLRLISIITKLDFKMNHIKTAICAGALLLLMLAAGQERALCQPSGKNLGLKTVVIDPGHGGKDPVHRDRPQRHMRSTSCSPSQNFWAT